MMSDLLKRKDDYFSQTIIGATQRNRPELLRRLLSQQNSFGLDDLAKAVNIAAEKGFDGCVEVLLSHGALPDVHDLTGLTPLLVAARNGHAAVLKLLLNAKCKINKPSFGIRATALHWAATNNHVECVQTLLLAGANTEVETVHRHTPLMLASRAGFADIVDELIHAGCSLDTADYSKMTALHLAAEEGTADCMRLLLDAGARCDQPNKRGETAIMLAAKNGHSEVFHMLFKMVPPVPPEWRCCQLTLLHWAAYGGSVECIQSLLDQDIVVDVKCLNSCISCEFVAVEGVTPLMLAGQRGHVVAIDLLLKYGADTGCVDSNAMTALLHAIKQDKVACVRILFNYGVNPNGNLSTMPHFIDNDRFLSPGLPLTPLMFAINENSVQSAKALLQANCDVEMMCEYMSDSYIMAFEFALYRKRSQMCKLLLSCGLRPVISNAAIMQEGLAWIAQEDEQFFADMMLLLISAPRLVDITRRTIRRSLGMQIVQTLNDLPLPPSLKQFLDFADVEVSQNL